MILISTESHKFSSVNLSNVCFRKKNGDPVGDYSYKIVDIAKQKSRKIGYYWKKIYVVTINFFIEVEDFNQ